MTAPPPVTVLVPTHAHPTTLGPSVRSVLAQNFTDLAVLIIADGVGDDSRYVIEDLRREDSRVDVVDRPKARRHAESVRHEVLGRPDMSPFVGYHGDDDLLLPDHVSTMMTLLADHDFVHPLPVLVRPDDSLRYLPLDLSRPDCVAWELGEPPRNAISLTGVMHTLSSYRRLRRGWRPAPADRWTDHYMWQQYLALPGLRAATADRATTIKLLGDDEGTDSGPRCRRWLERLQEPDFPLWWNGQVAAAVRDEAVATAMRASHLEDDVRRLQQSVTDAEARADELSRDLSVVHNSRSWRLTAPLRRAAACGRRASL